MADYTVTVGTGKTYSTPALACAGVSDRSSSYDNLVFVIDAGAYAPPDIEGCAWTASASHHIIFRAASGAHHNFTRATGVRFVTSDNWSNFTTNKNYVDFYNIAFTVTSTEGTYSAITCESSYHIFDSCFAYDCYCDGITCVNWNTAEYIWLINSAAVNCDGVGLGSQSGSTGHTDMRIYNCTVLNCGIGINDGGYRTAYAINCYAGGCATRDYGNWGNFVFTTCRSSDGSQSTTVISVANCQFTNSAAGSEDIEIGSSSSLIGIGSSLASDETYPFSVDGIGTSRGTSWDVGAIEYAPASTSYPYYYQQMQM